MSGEAGGRGGLFRELRRRNVFKVATVYLIASWLLIQIAETTFPALKLPEWTVTFVVVVLALLFPIAVIFAWAFELTPEGLKKTAEVDPGASITTQTGQRINYVIIGVLTLAVVVLVSTHGAFRDDPVDGGVTSIAVLPFLNMSNDPGNDHFSDDLSEELLNVLAQVDGLQVAARTSSFYFKDKNEPVDVIADKLGVDHVLEGSVRKSGNRIRATAQLIRADDGFHVWSENYDYEVDNIFDIQDEIALAVVDKLKVNLLGEERERMTRRTTTSVEAQQAYQEGRRLLDLRRQDALQEARERFQDARRADRRYALAYSGLSDAIQLLSNNHGLLSPAQAEAESRPLLERAKALDPESAEVWASIGLMEMHAEDLEAAEAALAKAIELNPSYASGYLWLASLRSRPPYGDAEAALELYRRVLKIDPISRVARQNIGASLMELGRLEEAEAEFRRAITLDPDYTGAYRALGNLYASFFFRFDEAHRWYQKAHELAPEDLSITINLPVVYQTLGMTDEYERWSNRMYAQAPTHPIAIMVPIWQALLANEPEKALAEIAIAERQGNAVGDFLRQFKCSALSLAGRPEEIVPMLEEHNPELFRSPADVNDFNNGVAVCAVMGLVALGMNDERDVVVEAARHYAETDVFPEANRAAYRAVLELAAGNEDEAVVLMVAAVDAGWAGSFNWGWRLRDDPFWSSVSERPEIVEIAAVIDGRMAEQREAVEAQLRDLKAGRAL